MGWWAETKCLLRACLKKEGLAFCAFIVASGCGVVLSAMLGWNIWYLQHEKQHDAVANIAYGLLLSIFVMQMSLHKLFGSKQLIEAELWKMKLKLGQGSDEQPHG